MKSHAALKIQGVVVLSVKISGCAQQAGTLDKDVKRVVKAAQDHALNLTRLTAKGGQK